MEISRRFFQLSQEDIDGIIFNNATELWFCDLSKEKMEKLRDEDVISIIDNHVKADEIKEIDLDGCVGITDTAITHIATNCTQLRTLYVSRCDQITDHGIKAIVEKIGNKLTRLGYDNNS